MLTKYLDITLIISEFLTNKEKITLSATSKLMDSLKYRFRYCEKIFIAQIKHLPFFDNFESVVMFNILEKTPKNMKYLYFTPHDANIPPNVTHLYFYYYLDRSTRIHIPSSVINLTFGCCFDRAIYGDIPSSVTHLTFDHVYNQSIENYIPQSVTHLTFGHYFDKSIKGCLSPSITHIEFGYYFSHKLINIPKTIVEIILHERYDKPISDEIKSKIKFKKC